MVVFVLALHPIGNIILGAVFTGVGFFGGFEITTHCLRAQDSHTRDYKSITVHNKIVIDEENNSEDKSITLYNTVKFKKKVNFSNVVGFRTVPNKDESPKSEIWYGNNDYISFRNEDLKRRKNHYNLQEMMAQVKENEHLNNMLEEMQEKEHQQELDRIKKEKMLD